MHDNNNSTTSLPYIISMSQSSAPLMLIFRIFIDDYSKFTWIYLLRLKSDVYNRTGLLKSPLQRLILQISILIKPRSWFGIYIDRYFLEQTKMVIYWHYRRSKYQRALLLTGCIYKMYTMFIPCYGNL
ncbi:hypothetical protein ACJX0J_025420, partial [Zea mays]